MPYIDPEIITEAKRMDLLTYLQHYEPDELVHVSGGEYRTRTHDSLRISNGLWNWCSHGVGGKNALEYLIQVKGLPFVSAVETIVGRAAEMPPSFIPKREKQPKTLLLPPDAPSNAQVIKYLQGRGIAPEIIQHCLDTGRLYEGIYRTDGGREFRQCVFVGFDPQGEKRYANIRSIGADYKGEATGSDKRYSFCLTANKLCDTVHVYESAIDALSHATLMKMYRTDWRQTHLLSLAGVYTPKSNRLPLALSQFLSEHSGIKQVSLHLDLDPAGRNATEAIKAALADGKINALDSPPKQGKDVNDFLCQELRERAKKRDRSNAR